MIVVMNRITVSEGREQEFEETFKNRDRAVDEAPGFVEMQVLRPSEGRTYVVMTRWQTRAAFQDWTESQAFRVAHSKQPTGLAEGRPQLEIYEILAQ